MQSNRWSAVLLAMLACGGDGEDAMGEALADAGQLIADAGQAIADAGRALADAGSTVQGDSGSARAQSQPAAKTMDVRCSMTRTSSSGITTRHAIIDVDYAKVRTLWACADAASIDSQPCPGTSCTGDVVPLAQCVQTTGALTTDRKLLVGCGSSATHVTIVTD